MASLYNFIQRGGRKARRTVWATNLITRRVGFGFQGRQDLPETSRQRRQLFGLARSRSGRLRAGVGDPNDVVSAHFDDFTLRIKTFKIL